MKSIACWIRNGRDSAVGKLEAELGAMNRKRASTQVEMILKDPCFELWLLLHFEFTDRPYTSVRGGRSACADVIERLQRHIPEYRKNTTHSTASWLRVVSVMR